MNERIKAYLDKIPKSLNRLSDKDGSYQVLKKLVKLSINTYGKVEFEDYNSAFCESDKQKLYNILKLLERKQYIDLDYPDDDKTRFRSLVIMPNGYVCIEQSRITTLNVTLSVTAILVAIISLFQ